MFDKFMLLACLLALLSCGKPKNESVAIISDVHFHDVFADFKEVDFKGLNADGKFATIRTMYAQLTSTRLFNENYFAFIAALDDIAKKKIKLVAIAGDITDDGQPIHLTGLEKILSSYQKKYGMQFFMTFGNHDPNRPTNKDAGIDDWLGHNGDNQAIYSISMKDSVKSKSSNQVLFTNEVTQLGYEGLTEAWQKYGFMPKKEYLYYETPFSTYNQANYSYAKALEQNTFEKRQYSISSSGNLNNSEKSYKVFDGSYLAEPIEGLWILSIDSNIYKVDADGKFGGSGDNGYPAMITHKAYLLDWIKKVCQEADRQNKKLITFSHLPLGDFFDGSMTDIEALFGKGKMQSTRNPSQDTVAALASLGVKVHFAGHMHINDNALLSNKQNFLLNVQVPSLAAYLPAYKVVSFPSPKKMQINTIAIDNVKNFDALFAHYKLEHAYLTKQQSPNIWNIDILKAKTYREFTDWHMRELVRLRFMKKEWPSEIIDFLKDKSMYDISLLATSQEDLNKALNEMNLSIETLKAISTTDMIIDFHRFLNGDVLIDKEVSAEKKTIYAYLNKIFMSFNKEASLKGKLSLIFKIIAQQTIDIPYKDLIVDLETNQISPK